jgi:hypothetical protein
MQVLHAHYEEIETSSNRLMVEEMLEAALRLSWGSSKRIP